jgi:hypothetical protein
MTSRFAADELVLFQSENLNAFNKSLVTNVVCELRFPTLMELGEAKPPSDFVKALRKSYPHIETGTDVSFGFGGLSETSYAHVFRASKGGWVVSLKHSTLTIETSSYTRYEDLERRVLEAVRAAKPIIDSDFWTRIGLRYINTLPGRSDPISKGWVNAALISPIQQGVFRGINEAGTRLVLNSEDGGCTLQANIRRNAMAGSEFIAPDFLIDVDVFRSDVEVADTEERLKAMHSQAFNVFDWSLDEGAREFLRGNGGK